MIHGLIGIACFLLGLLAAHLKLLQLEEKINPGHLVSTMGTVVIALVINTIFNRSASARTIERGVYFDLIKEIGESLADVAVAFDKYRAAAAVTADLTAELRRSDRVFANAIHSLDHAFTCTARDRCATLDQLRESRLDLKEIMLDDVPNGEPFPQEQAAKVEAELKKLKDLLTSLTFEVSKKLN